ncbi:MAG: signal peptide peptidase SppA [Myxococcota bacterium]
MRARFSLVLLACLGALPAHAQLRRATGGVAAPVASRAVPGSAYALELAPGALGLSPSWELAALHVQGRRAGDEGADAPLPFDLRGNTLAFVAPLGAGVAVGASVDWIRGDLRGDRGRVSLGLGFAPARRVFGLGLVLRQHAGGGADGVTSLDLGLALRPHRRLALALTAHDLLAPTGLDGAEGATRGTYVLASELRLFGDDALTLGATLAADTAGDVAVAGRFDVRVPRLGRARVAVEAERLGDDAQVFRVLGGLAVDVGRGRAEGGVIAGDGVRDLAGYAGLRLRGASAPEGMPTGQVVQEFTVAGSGTRAILGLLARLDAARRDRRVAGVLLRMRAGRLPLSRAQEIREAVVALEAAGKPVACLLQAATGGEILACGAASRRVMEPAGYVRLLGPSSEILSARGLLERAGVRADFVRIGRYKSAVELYQEEAPTEPALTQRQAFLDDAWERLQGDLAADFDRTPEAVAELIDAGPFEFPGALEAGLVDGAAEPAAAGAALRDLFGRRRIVRATSPRLPTTSGLPRRVAVIVIDGSIVDGENQDVPLVGIRRSGARTLVPVIEAARRDATVAAVVLRVDSPGGSALASDQIWRAVRRLAAEKPVVASMGAVAASGGYYVASPATEIWATPTTLTGSIGVFFGKADVGPLAARLGVGVTPVTRGQRAGASSMYRSFTGDERAALAVLVRGSYRRFLHRVAGSRDLTPREVHAVAQGRIWSGEAAAARGLVDRLGGFTAALARAKALAGVPDDVEVAYVPARPSGLLGLARQLVTRGRAPALGTTDEAPPPALEAPLGLAPGTLAFVDALAGGTNGPLALLPFVVTP